MIWDNCYDDGWKDIIVPEAFAHPAKFSRGLIRRIYEYMIEMEYLKPDGTVLDPFGGVALGGLDAMINGLQWVGVELEPRFVDLGNQNIAKWRKDYPGMLPGTAVLLQGDSRRLAQVIQSAGALVSSPPYADGCAHTGGPAVQSHEGGVNQLVDYGSSPGQLGSMKPGDLDAAISSPPFENSNALNDPDYAEGRTNGGGPLHDDYGNSTGQLGQERGTTFWEASREIVAQCYAVLRPGAYAAFVVKGYVKNKKLVDFPAQWRQLCEACGFEYVEEAHASLVKVEHIGNDLFSGEAVHRRTERKSFFRRLAERKGSPHIDFETVLFLRKPGQGDGGAGAVITSPPYTDVIKGSGADAARKRIAEGRYKGLRPDVWTSNGNIAGSTYGNAYGSTPGQLGSMRPGTSPGGEKE